MLYCLLLLYELTRNTGLVDNLLEYNTSSIASLWVSSILSQ